MPKYWGKQIFSLGSFPEVGQKQKTEEKKREKKKKTKVGENNGQATHGARRHAWRTQAAWAKIDKSIFVQYICISFRMTQYYF